MSLLTDSQKHDAMYRGGETQKKAKAAMRRTATHLAAIHDDILRGQLGPIHANQLATLAEAARLMRHLADRTEAAASEADRIKARTDRRIAEALLALKAAPIASTADQVALIALGSYPFELRSLARDCAAHGAHRELPSRLADARKSIAWNAAKSNQKPADYIAGQLSTLPALRQTHDAFIRQIEQLVEVQTVERERAAA